MKFRFKTHELFNGIVMRRLAVAVLRGSDMVADRKVGLREPNDPRISDRVAQFRVYVLFLHLVLWWCTHKYFSKILFYCTFSFKIPIKSRCSDLHNKIEYFFTLTKSGVRG